MRAVFVYDARFYKEGADVYGSPTFAYAVWQRYLRHFEELTVVGRLAEAGVAGTVLSSGPHVRHILLPDYARGGLAAGSLNRARLATNQLIETSDAVIARLPSVYGLIGVWSAIREEKPWAAEIVGCAWDALWNHGTLRGKLIAPLMWWLMRRTIGRAAAAMYVTREFLQRRYPCLALLAPDRTELPGEGLVVGRASDAGGTGLWICGSASDVEIGGLGDLNSRISALADAGVRRNFVVGHIGSLRVRYKGLHTLLRALARVRSVLPRWELRVLGAGDPTCWTRLAQHLGIEAQVHFEGALATRRDVFAWLDQVDLYVQPSFQEGLPRALVEAMSRGCPCVGSTAGGIPELLTAECLHRPGDVRALANLILRAARDGDWRIRQAVRNHKIAAEYLSEVLGRRRAAFWSAFVDQLRRGSRQPVYSPG